MADRVLRLPTASCGHAEPGARGPAGARVAHAAVALGILAASLVVGTA